MPRLSFVSLFLLVGACAADKNAPLKIVTASAVSDRLPSQSREITMTWRSFHHALLRGNLDLAAERYNLSIKDAEILVARQLKNPTLDFGLGDDVTYSGSEKLQSNVDIGITQTFELGGKRRLRTDVARINRAASSASLDDFLHQIKYDAAGAFAEALAFCQAAKRAREAAQEMAQTFEAQQSRFQAGEISEADLIQTKVEKDKLEAEAIAAEAELTASQIALASFLGVESGQLIIKPVGNLEMTPGTFEEASLVREALSSRPDLIALRHEVAAAAAGIRLEKANRIPDLDVGIGVSHASTTHNSVAPTPGNDTVGITFSLPLPLWDRNKGGIRGAEHVAAQAAKRVQAAELKTQVEVRKALAVYRAALSIRERYRSGVLKDAETVMEARQASYEKGESSLLELLEARRTAREVRLAYENALAAEAKALIELYRSSAGGMLKF